MDHIMLLSQIVMLVNWRIITLVELSHWWKDIAWKNVLTLLVLQHIMSTASKLPHGPQE